MLETLSVIFFFPASSCLSLPLFVQLTDRHSLSRQGGPWHSCFSAVFSVSELLLIHVSRRLHNLRSSFNTYMEIHGSSLQFTYFHLRKWHAMSLGFFMRGMSRESFVLFHEQDEVRARVDLVESHSESTDLGPNHSASSPAPPAHFSCSLCFWKDCCYLYIDETPSDLRLVMHNNSLTV